LHAPEPLTESTVVQDIFASGLARIEDVGGGNFRLTLYAFQKSVIFEDQRRERVVVARLVIPKGPLLEAAKACIYASQGIEGAVGETYIEGNGFHGH
jgi:hypothetical protein